MSFKLMYITNQPQIAKLAEGNGVDWIFVDLELLGKMERQGHLDTVISKHTIDDVKNISKVLNHSELLVRCNPIHIDSKKEIDEIIDAGADIVMLPFYKTVEEVQEFIGLVNSRAKVCLLLETSEAVEILDAVLELEGVDYIHIGLNDLSLSYQLDFMFEPLANGLVERICHKIRQKGGIPYGIGGISQLGKGDLPSDIILGEHIYLGSSMAILSRNFCDAKKLSLKEVEHIFSTEVQKIRDHIRSLDPEDEVYFLNNREIVKGKVAEIVDRIRKKKGI